MKEEPSYKLNCLESHDLLFITTGIIPPAEGDVAVLIPKAFGIEDTVITDCDPVGISAQILKDSFSAIERRFAIDNPFFMIEPSSEHLKAYGILQMTDASWEDKSARFKTAFKIVQELAPEQ